MAIRMPLPLWPAAHNASAHMAEIFQDDGVCCEIRAEGGIVIISSQYMDTTSGLAAIASTVAGGAEKAAPLMIQSDWNFA